MKSTSIILVSLVVDHRKEADFNDFYHHEYIPKLLKVVPEIYSVKRYEEYNTNSSLRYYHKQYWTIYHLNSENPNLVIEAIKNRPGREKQKSLWLEWQKTSLRNVQHATLYRQRYIHPREPMDGPFDSRPFFCVSVEMHSGDEVEKFNDWYENIYLPKNLADVPTWVACRGYESCNNQLFRNMTIYEAKDENGLKRSLELMRAPHRLEENASWSQWDAGQNPLIIWEDATCFVPIYRYPD